MSARWLAHLKASTFNQLCQYASSPTNTAYCLQNLPLLP